jgi:hypothetical protein
MKATVNGMVVEGTVEEISALMLAMAPAKAPSKREEATKVHNEVMAHVHDRRMARREATVLGGLTSKERKALAATLPEGYSHEMWVEAVTAYKAATK